MIEVIFDGPGADLARRVGLSHDEVNRTLNDRHRDLFVPGKVSKLYAIRWFEDGRIVYADGVVTGERRAAGGEPEAPSLDRVEQVTTTFALSLTPQLPAGFLDPRAELPDLLPAIANSFGMEIICQPGTPPSKLYSGPWDGRGVAIKGPSGGGGAVLTGTLESATLTCHYVWVLSVDLYLRWWDAQRPGEG